MGAIKWNMINQKMFNKEFFKSFYPRDVEVCYKGWEFHKKKLNRTIPKSKIFPFFKHKWWTLFIHKTSYKLDCKQL